MEVRFFLPLARRGYGANLGNMIRWLNLDCFAGGRDRGYDGALIFGYGFRVMVMMKFSQLDYFSQVYQCT